MPNMKQLLLICLTLSGISVFAQNFKVAYNIYDTVQKDYEVWIMDADGSNKKNLSNKKAVDWTYHADGQTIYFISDRDTCYRCFYLYQINADGSQLRKISDLQLEDSWMDNYGKTMIVSARQGASVRFQLATIDLETGSFTWLTNDTASYFSDPVFVENGQKIAYRFRKNRRNQQEKAEIWLMKKDASERTRLTSYPDSDTSSKWHSYHAGPPRWNAAKRFISYQSLQKGNYQLYAITPDGKKQWQLTEGEQKPGWHDWSADGNWLVADITDSTSRYFDIGIMRFGEKKFQLLTGRRDWKTNMSPAIVEYRE